MKACNPWKLLVAVSYFGLCGCGSSNSANSPQTTGIPAGYESLCATDGVTCQTNDSPLNLVGIYNGTETVVVTSNEIWNVGVSEAFTAVVATQNGEAVTGSFDMGGYHYDITQATVRGDSTQFTFTVRILRSKPIPMLRSPPTARSRRVSSSRARNRPAEYHYGRRHGHLVFTKNIHGSGCTEDEINNYPGTGATFKYTATRTP